MADTEARVVANLVEQVEALKKENYLLSTKNCPVCVTGCSGYIASLLTKMLCEAGYKVRGTVRSTGDPVKVAHLQGLCPTNPVELFEADLLGQGSFNDAVAGCSVVFHTASPFQTNVEDGQRDLVDPAVKGTLNVLASCKAAGTVERVVLTSSIAAVKDSSNEKYGESRPMGYVWTHENFNETSTVETNAYSYSKVTAEKAAWDFLKGTGISMCTINPAFVLGPVLSGRTDATSVKTVKGMLDGSMKKANSLRGAACFGSCDIRDVCKAHIRAMEVYEANGRYLVTTRHSNPFLELANMLATKYTLQFPDIPTEANGEVPAENMRHKMCVDKTEKDLGFQLSFSAQTLHDMAESMIEHGVVTPVNPASS